MIVKRVFGFKHTKETKDERCMWEFSAEKDKNLRRFVFGLLFCSVSRHMQSGILQIMMQTKVLVCALHYFAWPS